MPIICIETRHVKAFLKAQGKAIAIENDIRGFLRNFGLKVGVVGTVKFENRIRDLVAGMPDLEETHGTIACRSAEAA